METNLNLTISDCDILIEAMDSWKSRTLAGDLMGSIFTAMLSKNIDPVHKAELEQQEEERQQKKEIKDREEKINKLKIPISILIAILLCLFFYLIQRS